MNLKILKLKSGEEIACQVLEQNESTVKIFQPMLFRVVSSFDDQGNPCDLTTLHDWLVNTDDKNVSIPMSHITFITEPNKNTKKLYKLESEKEFNPENFKTTVEENKPDLQMNEKDADVFGMFLQELVKQSKNLPDWGDDILADRTPKEPKRKRSRSKKNTLPPDMTDESELDRHMIMMQLYIPAEAIMNMVTSGLLDPKVLLDMIKEVKKRNKFTGDEKDRGDFGNKLSDWNPDPKSDDYS
jgi:hypothetical protein